MKRPRPLSLGEILKEGEIARLTREAEDRRNLAEVVRARLPAAEAAHVVGAHFDARERLVVTVDSAAWAARIRFLAADSDRRRLRVCVAPRGGAAN
jgi:hypothetical protein